MTRFAKPLGCSAVLSLTLLLATPACAGSQAKGFEKFCRTWMGKLEAREKQNLASAKVKKRGETFVVEYTGYDKKILRCETKETGVPSNPYVGKLVYHELRLKKTGERRAAARGSSPEILAQTEILEIFRYDGKSWVY